MKIFCTTFFKIIKKIKLRTLIIIIVLLLFNSYAWFIYATKVSGGLTAHITSWNVSFQAGEDQSTTQVAFDVDRIYPGMETYKQTLQAQNKGETKAKLSYTINSVTILGTTYKKNETTTSDDLLNRIQTYYPFHINISVNNTELEAGIGTGTFEVSLEWPFESGNDHEDTVWGEAAYEFYAIHPGEKSIHVELELTATQTK